MTHLALPAAAALGAATWTFAEYALHAWRGHGKGRSEFTREHLRHHGRHEYFSPAGRKVRLALPVVGAAAALGASTAGWALGLAFAAGFAAAYAGYEWLHRRLHTHPPLNRYGAWARRHHFRHHFVEPSRNHGVTTPLWDWVFGTLEPSGPIEVPRRFAMRWLLDPETGLVRAEHRRDYTLRGGGTLS